jgi:hypothetical protein
MGFLKWKKGEGKWEYTKGGELAQGALHALCNYYNDIPSLLMYDISKKLKVKSVH